MTKNNNFIQTLRLAQKRRAIKFRELVTLSLANKKEIEKSRKSKQIKAKKLINKIIRSWINSSVFTNFHTNNNANSNVIRPWQITGLVDSEGAFTCSVSGRSVKLEFKVTQKKYSAGILTRLDSYFNCGSIVIDNSKTVTLKYRVSSLSDILGIIIPHFESYPCFTSKNLNFRDWKKIALIMKDKKHLTTEGLAEIMSLLANMNKNRSFEDKFNYCKNSLGLTDNGEVNTNLPADWIQSFIDGEGTFYNYLASKKIDSRGRPYQICNSSLEIAQNSHDVAVLIAIKQYFGGGYIKPKYNFIDVNECKKSRSVNRFILRDTKTIINFVNNHPMLTRKQLDYLDWKKVVELKNQDAHKTVEGLELMRKIISNMNSTRKDEPQD